jgi:hypothetical protein
VKSILLFVSALLSVLAFGVFMYTAGMNRVTLGVTSPWVAGNLLFVLAAAFSVAEGVRSLPNYSLKRTDQSLRD